MEPPKPRKPWPGRVRLLDDAPIYAPGRDLLGFEGMVALTASSLRHAKGPMVVHVDGSWGRGKTSFCRLVEQALGGDEDQIVTTAWYVASDERIAAWDAVLATVARAITQGDPEETARILRTWGAGGDPKEATVDFESFRRWVGRELGWEDRGAVEAWTEPIRLRAGRLRRHHASEDDGEAAMAETEARAETEAQTTMEAEVEADAPAPAPASLLPAEGMTYWSLAPLQTKRRIAVVFIDDLDRCRPDHVQAVFDAVRAFVTCKGVMFVVAADRAVLQRAFEAAVEQLGAEGTRHADEAMEKYIRHTVDLPAVSQIGHRLTTQMEHLQAQMFEDGDFRLLRGPGLAMADGVAVLIAQAFSRSLTLRRLKRILNALVVDLANAAERARLSDEALEFDAHESGTLWRPEVLAALSVPDQFRKDVPTGSAEYPRFFVSRLIFNVARHMWRELLEGVEIDGQEFSERIRSLLAVGRQEALWPEGKLVRVLEQIVPPGTSGVPTPLETQREFCRFLTQLYESIQDSVVVVEEREVGRSDEASPEVPAGEPARGAEDEGEEAQAQAWLREDDDALMRTVVMNRTVDALGAVPVPRKVVADYVQTAQPEPMPMPSGIAPKEMVRAHEEVSSGSSREPVSSEMQLRKLHGELLEEFAENQRDPVIYGPNELADVFNKVDLLLSARIGHPTFDPERVFDGLESLLRNVGNEQIKYVATYLNDILAVARHWRQWEFILFIASLLHDASGSDPATRVKATAYILEGLSQPGALSGYRDLPVTVKTTPSRLRFDIAVNLIREAEETLVSADEDLRTMVEGEALVEIVDRMARLFVEPDEARVLVQQAGFPAAMMPRFTSSLVFWNQVMTQAENGVLRGGVRPLLGEALRRFPNDIVLARALGLEGRGRAIEVGDEVHLHYARALVAFVRVAAASGHTVPDDVAAHESRHRESYALRFLHDTTIRTALEALEVARTGDVADRRLVSAVDDYYERTTHQPKRRVDQDALSELALALADVYVDFTDDASAKRAAALYSSLEGTSYWTPAVLHNLATLHAADDPRSPRAGRLWERAYRAGYRDSRMLRAFSQFLKGLGSNHAVLVAQQKPLPEDWHPFGIPDAEGELHVPPHMLVR